ncbi:DUF262 domain-containing protein [Campylobacter canadensis]|uniref:DUF262 domain-containing protein n=1 Tax=Campylobacter canadensis TaxID=449520 RepID=UPI001CCC3BC6|nr:DUF262 domain-containing protein [Campylobacter canadensis]MBZ7996726.1 DUF262 domain-containing protein [Campylobacter canadensis]MBZ8000304.1 DUF262 domain-containing protein [Campylobacter canadensis]MBZ8002041.1 DUF262 domain-containing protein [Campylobacter canadensis]MBZ8004037.1 DUF262 domain-containing protein [Campylobacter canadensis]
MEQIKTISQICKLGDILESEFNKIFIIPPYQRLYAWDKEQIKILLDDFKNCINDNSKTHFIGNVVVANNEDNFELVDGQQRLSTIFFLCVYMCFKNNKMQEAKGEFEKAYKFAFVNSEDKNSNNHKCRIRMPIREDDENAIWNYDFDRTNTNIKLAFDYFDEYFEDNELKSFCNFIFTNVRFNLVILGDQVELNKYFVRMNNTGVQLNGTDILKARLLKLISDNDKSEVTEYARIFDECSQMNYFSDFGFVNNSENNNMIGESQKIEKIIQGHKISKKEDKKKERAEFESIIDFPTFILHVFKILSKSSEKIFKEGTQISIKKDKFLENTWDKLNDNLNAEQVKKIIEALKEYRIIFDTFVIKRKADDDENVYKLWNRFSKNSNKNDDWHEVDNTTELKLIQNYLRVARRGDNTNYHHFLTHYLEFCKKRILESKTYLGTLQNKAEELKNYLKNLDTALAYKSLEEDSTNSLLDITDNFKNENKNYELKDNCFNFLNKGTNTLHYWFYRLEYYLLTDENFKKKHKDDIEKYRFRYVNSVEHVLAQNDVSGLAKQEENQEVLDNFGNLVLITDGENSGFSNKPFNEKQSQFDSYLKKGLVISLKLLDIYKNEEYQKDDKGNILNNKIWQKTQIEKHQNAMLGVLKDSFFNSQEQVKNN